MTGGLTPTQRQQALLLWNYHQLHHQLRAGDVAIGLGCYDLGVAAYAAQLYHAGLAPLLLFTGGVNPLVPEKFPRGEAAHFREHAVTLGVPEQAIWVEPQARNTGENILFSRRLLTNAGITPATVLLVTMPYMQRRAFATTRRVWPQVQVVCASEPISFDDYLQRMGDAKLVVDQLVGDLQRVVEYPKRGFAITQQVPPEVYAAYESLAQAGFDSRLR